MTATLPPSSPATRPKFDILGAITLAATVSSIFLAIEFSDTKWGVSIFLRILLYVFTVLSFIAFLYVETRPSSQKVVPLRYMKAGIVRNSILCYSLIMFLYTAVCLLSCITYYLLTLAAEYISDFILSSGSPL